MADPKKGKQQPKKKPQQPRKPAAPPARSSNPYLWIGLSLVLTLIAYLPAFQAGFVNWDDDDYVGKNFYIRDFSHVKELMTVPVQGNHHPLTMLSLAVTYAISGDKPWAYHAINVLLHLLNTFLVFRLASRLSKGNTLIAFATALLFGVHPMHVESVAWVSERKDVLYTFFFLLGLIRYLKYIDGKVLKDYTWSWVWFCLSIASKPAAIVFPAVLFAFDFFRSRKAEVKLFTEKIPFFLVSGLFLWLTLTAQTTVGATDAAEYFPLQSRIFFAFYGFMMYIVKLAWPVGLAAFYSLPPINEPLPVLYFASPVVAVLVAVLCLFTWKKYPVVTFAFAFFFFNLMLVLQLKVIGSAIMADRYAYVPYIGLFFLIGWWLDKTFGKKPSTAYALLTVTGLVLTAMSYSQASTWKSSEALWDNAIRHAPSERAYVHRATFYRKEGKPDKALELYDAAIKLNKIAHSAYCNRANIYFDRGQDSLAMEGYNKSLEIKPDYVPALDNRGALFARMGNMDAALADLNRAIALDPKYPASYSNRALVYYEKKQYEKSIEDCRIYLKYYPRAHEIYNSIGVACQAMQRYEQSIEAIGQAIAINPQPVYYLNRSYAWNAMGKKDEARKDALAARNLGLPLPAGYAASLGL